MTAPDIRKEIEQLNEIMSLDNSDVVPAAVRALAIQAYRDHDDEKAAQALSAMWKLAATHAGGHEIESLDGEEFGRKVGWLSQTKKTRSDRTIEQYLAKYARDLLVTPMQDAVRAGAVRGIVKEVVREAEGTQTCDWCLERCGVWDPYDANAYGVWARHAGCDCDIHIRYVEEDE